MTDLFGLGIPLPKEKVKGKRGTPTPHGHAARPGSGPEGECCGTCQHLYRNRMAKTYLKCELMRRFWTGGRGSDVRAKDPACRNWQARAALTTTQESDA